METDKGGVLIENMLESAGHVVISRQIVRDDAFSIRSAVETALNSDTEAVIVTGGTGVCARDCTPEAITPMFTKELPGFGEIFRVLSFQEVGAAAMLSRAFGGVMGRTILFALPGSISAVTLGMEKLILPELAHLVRELRPERRK
jgi:molybdenum cofactor biosynthesis protein B